MPDRSPLDRIRAARSTGDGRPAQRRKQRTVEEHRERVLRAMQADPLRPEVVMARAREARKAGALTAREFRKLLYNYGPDE